MTLDLTLTAVEKSLAGAGRRPIAMALLRAVLEHGGSIDSAEAKRNSLDVLGDRLTPGQKEYLRRNRISWTISALRGLGLLRTDTPGAWTLTELGRQFAEFHQNDALEAPPNVPDGLDSKALPIRETVKATETLAYDIPLLKLLSERGEMTRAELYSAILERLGASLLPGDRRTLPSREEVAWTRVGWSLSGLKRDGHAISLRRGSWAITEQGKSRLEKEESSWKLENFQRGKSSVLQVTVSTPTSNESVGDQADWQRLVQDWGAERIQSIQGRLRPDLGATPASGQPNRNLILYGPPGTGKTYLAKQLARALTGDEEPGNDSRWRVVQFHPSYAYEDFVQGIRPALRSGALNYELRNGPLLELCRNAVDDPDNFYVLVIDEINRGDPARIFGEALYALEYRGESIDLAVAGFLNIPHNVVMIGTMNSVDRSVALVDYALRRRFGFIRLQPDPEIVSRIDLPGAEAAAILLAQFNQWLVQQLGEEYTLGHSFFFGTSTLDRGALERIWRFDWLPLLEEYFYGDQQRLKEANSAWLSYLNAALSEQDEE